MKNKKIAAFTLTELMIAVLILGIIASMASVGYDKTKKSAEYNTAVAQVGAIVGAQKNYKLSMESYASTTGTTNTNDVFGIKIFDGYFRNFRVNTAGGTFTILVDGGNCVYTFNSEGTMTGDNGGVDCLP